MSLFVSYSKVQNKSKKRNFKNVEDNENCGEENLPKKSKLATKAGGMGKRKSKVMPLGELNAGGNNDINMLMAEGLSSPDQQLSQQQTPPEKSQKKRVSDGSGKGKTPLPVAVARRNARERNRVKQVNNGFACLRQHIPDEIAEAFETPSSARNSAKKLSKVETLRMAVEYIRNLEQLLDLNLDTMSNSNMSFLSESSLPATPPPEQSQAFFYAIKPRNSFGDNDEFPNNSETEITIINGQQYVRIPGTNTFELIEPEHLYENDENLQPLRYFHKLNSNSSNSSNNNSLNSNNNNLIDEPITSCVQQQPTLPLPQLQPSAEEFINILDPRLEEYICKETPAGSSPSGYSVQSALSPAPPSNIVMNIKQEDEQPKCPIQHQHYQQHQHNNFNQQPQQQLQQEMQHELEYQQRQPLDSFYTLKMKTSPASLLDENSNNNHNINNNYDDLFLENNNPQQHLLQQLHQHYGGLLTLKTEIKDDSQLLSDSSLNSDNILEAMNWWNEQQRRIDCLNRSTEDVEDNSNSSFIS